MDWGSLLVLWEASRPGAWAWAWAWGLGLGLGPRPWPGAWALAWAWAPEPPHLLPPAYSVVQAWPRCIYSQGGTYNPAVPPAPRVLGSCKRRPPCSVTPTHGRSPCGGERGQAGVKWGGEAIWRVLEVSLLFKALCSFQLVPQMHSLQPSSLASCTAFCH